MQYFPPLSLNNLRPAALCWPAPSAPQAGFAGEVVDSDEEDPSQMDSAKGKSRYDFNTEEEWQKYKETREQMPKAAFQYGVKSADGRKSGKDVVSRLVGGLMGTWLHRADFWVLHLMHARAWAGTSICSCSACWLAVFPHPSCCSCRSCGPPLPLPLAWPLLLPCRLRRRAKAR